MTIKKQRIAKINGKKIEVSAVPPMAILRFGKLSKKIRTGRPVDTFQTIEDIAEILSMICVKQSSEMTKDWFLDELDVMKIIQIAKYIFEPDINTPMGQKFITRATNQEYVGNGPLAGLFALGRMLEEAILNALESVFFRQVSELAPVNENYKNAHKIALEDGNTQWILASFRSKRRREDKPLICVSDLFFIPRGGDCAVCL